MAEIVANLGNLVVARDLARVLFEVRNDRVDRKVDAALEVHRVHAGGNGLCTLADNCLGEDGGRGRAVASVVVGLGRYLAHHLGAHVLELVGEFDLLGDGHTVLGDARGAEAFLDHDVAALWPERDLHCIGENIDALEHPVAGIEAELDFFGSHLSSLLET